MTNFFLVTEVIDGDTIVVSPDWKHIGRTGSRVRLSGVHAPELNTPEGQRAKERLSHFLLNQMVELRNASIFSYGRLVCEVFLNGISAEDFL